MKPSGSRPNISIYIWFVLQFVLSCTFLQAQIPERYTVIKAGKLIHPAEKEIRRDQLILIKGEKIEAIGSRKQISIPDSANVIDLSDYTVFPGLMEAHTHLCMALPRRDNGRWMRAYWETFLSFTTTNSTAYRALVGASAARELLHAGFTTVRDLGNAGDYADTDLRRSIEQGLLQGPTIINAGKIIAPTGGQYIAEMTPNLSKWFSEKTGDYTGVLPPGMEAVGGQDYLFADTKDELKKAIRKNILHGAKLIKIVVDDQKYRYSKEDIAFIVKEAADAGLKVAAHCITAQGAVNAIEGGVASVEHGSDMSDESLKLAKEKGIFLVPAGGPLKRAYALGVKIAFGVDNIRQGTPQQSRADAILAYVKYYQQQGISTEDVLQMMTTLPAELLGVGKERGKIAEGYFADIIACKTSPYEDILALQQVNFVMKNGEVIKNP